MSHHFKESLEFKHQLKKHLILQSAFKAPKKLWTLEPLLYFSRESKEVSNLELGLLKPSTYWYCPASVTHFQWIVKAMIIISGSFWELSPVLWCPAAWLSIPGPCCMALGKFVTSWSSSLFTFKVGIICPALCGYWARRIIWVLCRTQKKGHVIVSLQYYWVVIRSWVTKD